MDENNRKTVKAVSFNPAIAQEMRSMVDRCQFATVKQHCRSERSPIRGAVIVEPPNLLWEIGALMCEEGDLDQDVIKSIEFTLLYRSGSLRIAVDKPAPHGERMSLDEFSDRRECSVIYLPPAYVVQFDLPEASEN